MNAILCHGLWVPAAEADIFARYSEFEGLPNLDVEKIAKCVALCTSYGSALDIGAHVGAVSVYLSRKFEQVFAFEAVPSTFEYLRRNTAELANVTALNVAAGPAAGEVYFSHYPRHGQLSHVDGGIAVEKTSRIGPVPVQTIDSMNLADVSFIKIDTEGFELPVIEGAVETIKRCRPLILVEQNGNEEAHFGRPRDEATDFLLKLGMRRHPDEPRMSKDRLFTF